MSLSTETRRVIDDRPGLQAVGNDLILRRIKNVNEAMSWPPGVMMAYHSGVFFGLGLIVANDGQELTVIWASQ